MEQPASENPRVSEWRMDVSPFICMACGPISGIVGVFLAHEIFDVLLTEHFGERIFVDSIPRWLMFAFLEICPVLSILYGLWVVNDSFKFRIPPWCVFFGLFGILGGLFWVVLFGRFFLWPVGWNVG